MATNAGANRREAMRLKAQAEELRVRRNSRVLWISLAAVAVVVVVILALVITQTVNKSKPSGKQSTPPNATEKYGIELKSTGTEAVADAPHLIIWEDYQCPACAGREQVYGSAVKQLVDQGKITVEIRTAHFLDPIIGNDSSERAALAAAAADAVGKFREYHETVYKDQPEEGVGYTDQQLRVDFAAAAGIQGDDLARFQNLYDGRAFADFVSNANDQFSRDGITSTPTYLTGDTQLQFIDEAQQPLIQPTPEDLLRAITEANT